MREVWIDRCSLECLLYLVKIDIESTSRGDGAYKYYGRVVGCQEQYLKT